MADRAGRTQRPEPLSPGRGAPVSPGRGPASLPFDPKGRARESAPPKRRDGTPAENVQVCCRIRPQLPNEERHGGENIIEAADGNRVLVKKHVAIGESDFLFDHVFGDTSSQGEVYDTAAKPIVQAVLEGFNGTVFAYGQTASGKTFTMEGEHMQDERRGVIPRMVRSVFDGIYEASSQVEFYVKVAIVEIYNERIRDLLAAERENLKIREGPSGIYIDGVTEKYVQAEGEIFEVMRRGKVTRAVASTNMNEHSSRSHLMFVLTVEQSHKDSGTVKVGRLHLVDLAGSENVAKSQATGGRLDEAKHINKSLSALGNVIYALTDKRHTHIPYRDSKLTRLLQEALGGNSKTCLILAVSPSSFNEAETLSTLRFGARAKLIKNSAKVNEELSVEELKALLQKQQRIVEEQKLRIQQLEDRCRQANIPMPAGGAVAAADVELAARAEAVAEVAAALEAMRAERDALREENAKLRTNDLEQNVADLMAERDSLQFERDEAVDEQDPLCQEVQNLLKELRLQKALALCEVLEAVKPRSDRRPAATIREDGDDAYDEDERPSRDGDKPLKRKVSQLDKNLEQLTVMYHKLVSQNNDLKRDNQVQDKSIGKSDRRIRTLESNLREAKTKYEKLLNQCANLTSAMDVYQGTRQSRRTLRATIRVPIRGGVRPDSPSPPPERE